MKLFTIVNTFDKKQRTGFLTYIKLYHKSETIIYKLAEWLESSNGWVKNRRDDFSSEHLLRESPFDFKIQTFSNALTILGNLSEEYLGWMVWKDSPSRVVECQLQGLAQKSLSHEYIKTQKEVIAPKGRTKINIWDDFYKMRSLFEDYNHKIGPFNDKFYDKFKTLVFHFKKSTSTLAQILKVELVNRERLLSENWKDEVTFLNLFVDNDTDVGKLSKMLVGMNEKDEEGSFKQVYSILKSDKIEEYSLYLKYFFNSYCILYVTRKIKQGETQRGPELLDLYDYSLKKGFFTLNDTMSLKQFNNIIGVASKLNNYEWARKRVDEWAFKVDTENGKTIAIFGHATIDFYQRKYTSVIHALSQMSTSNFQHRFSARWLYLRAQFELNREYVDAIKTQIDNFRRFVISNDKRINKQTFEGLKGSLKILNMILDRKDNAQIFTFYKKSKYIFERKWIMEKIKNPAK